MEVSSIVDIFRRSEAKRKARYVEYLGDGDSKSINAVNEDQPYGPDLKDQKLECINHVSKGMYARLEAVKTKERSYRKGREWMGRGG